MKMSGFIFKKQLEVRKALKKWSYVRLFNYKQNEPQKPIEEKRPNDPEPNSWLT